MGKVRYQINFINSKPYFTFQQLKKDDLPLNPPKTKSDKPKITTPIDPDDWLGEGITTVDKSYVCFLRLHKLDFLKPS